MFTWEKLGNVFDPDHYAETSRFRHFGQSPSALVLEDRVRVYFCTRPPPDADGQYKSYINHLDLDRNDLRSVLAIGNEPIIELGGFGTFDEFGTYPVSVIQDGDETRAYYAGLTRCESVPFNAAIGLAVSKDGGETFERAGAGPVLCYTPDEPFLLGSPRIRKFGDRWHLFYVSGKRWLSEGARPEPVYKIRMASSSDGIEWIRHGRDLLSDRLGPDECQACGDVTFRNGRYHMFYSYRRL